MEKNIATNAGEAIPWSRATFVAMFAGFEANWTRSRTLPNQIEARGEKTAPPYRARRRVRGMSWLERRFSTSCWAMVSPVANKTPPVRHCRENVEEVAAMKWENADILEICIQVGSVGEAVRVMLMVRKEGKNGARVGRRERI